MGRKSREKRNRRYWAWLKAREGREPSPLKAADLYRVWSSLAAETDQEALARWRRARVDQVSVHNPLLDFLRSPRVPRER